MSAGLAVEGVGKRYGAAWALRGVSFSAERGVLGLLGPNGAGKSTLLRIVATVTRPDEGRVLWQGEPVARRPDALRRVLGYLPQDFGVYPRLSAREFLRYLAAVKGLAGPPARRRTDELLALVDLAGEADRPLGGFSGGMRQRVGIAQALLADPQLLVVDEPTAGLDPEERAAFRDLVAELAGDRLVILSTHVVSDVEASATAIALLRGGELISCGPPEALIAAVRGRVWRLAAASAELPELRRRHLVTAVARTAEGVAVRLVADRPPAGAEAAEPGLEDAYLWRVRDGRPPGGETSRETGVGSRREAGA